jgi:hypothetical protein
MSDVPPQLHAFTHAPAALRIFRFAADTAPRVLELTRVSAFLRECAVEFGSADAALPGAMRNEYADGRYFWLRDAAERNAALCPWLAAKLLACRSGAPVPAEALAPDVTRHDVNWGAEGAHCHAELQLTRGGVTLARWQTGAWCWAQGAVGVTSSKHYFQMCVTALADASAMMGFADDKISLTENDSGPGRAGTRASGAVLVTTGWDSTSARRQSPPTLTAPLRARSTSASARSVVFSTSPRRRRA